MTSRFPASLRVIGRSFVDWWDGWLDMVMVIAVWFFAQFTIVLGPPATFGLYHVVYSMINGEALGVKGMIEGAKKYFWKSLQWGAVNLAVVIIITFSIIFYFNVAEAWGFYLFILVAMMAVLWVATQFYALPFFMEQEIKSVRIAMRNGVLTAMATPFFTFMLLVVVVLIVILSSLLVIPIFLGLPGVIPFLGFRALGDRLVAFGIRKAEKTPKEIEYEEGGRTRSTNLDRVENDDLDADEPADGPVTNGEGQIEQQK